MAVTDEQLLNRYKMLELYCKDLVQTNKILDLENRVAIAQLVNLLSPDQLNNFTNALRFIQSNPRQIYDSAPAGGTTHA